MSSYKSSISILAILLLQSFWFTPFVIPIAEAPKRTESRVPCPSNPYIYNITHRSEIDYVHFQWMSNAPEDYTTPFLFVVKSINHSKTLTKKNLFFIRGLECDVPYSQFPDLDVATAWYFDVRVQSDENPDLWEGSVGQEYFDRQDFSSEFRCSYYGDCLVEPLPDSYYDAKNRTSSSTGRNPPSFTIVGQMILGIALVFLLGIISAQIIKAKNSRSNVVEEFFRYAAEKKITKIKRKHFDKFLAKYPFKVKSTDRKFIFAEIQHLISR